MHIDPVISRYINTSSVVQCRMENRNRIILCHIDLVQDSESAILGAAVYTSLPKLYLIIYKSICADQIPAVCIYMKGYIINRSSEDPCKVFCQNILSCSLSSCKEKVFALEHRSNPHFQHFSSVKGHIRLGNSVFLFLRHRITASEGFYLLNKPLIHLLFS